MAIQKICGIETEYGIVVRGADNNPVSASSLLINAYLAEVARDGADAEPLAESAARNTLEDGLADRSSAFL